MFGYVGVTDKDWYGFLSSQAALDEVNFWQPSGGRAFRAIESGEPFFFKLKSPYNAIAGFGYFVRHSILPAWLAWEAFGVANGARSFVEMRQRIEKYRRGASASGEYNVGCLMVAEPVFFPEEAWIPQPRDWGAQTVQGKRIDVTAGEGLRIYSACLERADDGRRTDSSVTILGVAEPTRRYGSPALVHPRLGQGTFRIVVTEAYERACAVTTEHSLPVLEAAHIRPFSDDGTHNIRNGILLRTDIHRLFDRGYATITPSHQFEVSRRLREDYDNGRTYYALHGTKVRVPSSVFLQPNVDALTWHNENVFLG